MNLVFLSIRVAIAACYCQTQTGCNRVKDSRGWITLSTHLWRHEAFGRVLARPGDGPHPRARDEVKVGLPGRVEEGHLVDGAVVGGHAERDDLQLGQARRHRERLAAVRVLVYVPVAKFNA